MDMGTHTFGQDAGWLETEAGRLIDFAEAARDPRGGFAWLDDHGRPDPAHARQLWISCRMTHCFALAHNLGRPGAAELAAHGVEGLKTCFRDAANGGWYEALTADGTPTVTTKSAYPHAFVILAASSAAAAGIPGAAAVLDEALAVHTAHFWDEAAGAAVEMWDEGWTTLDGYRGANANMHTIEAYLAAADVTGDPVYRERALRIVTRLVDGGARAKDWRLPEHFDSDWQELSDYNRDKPDDPFRPYGATVGHGLEWSRLLLQLSCSLGPGAPDWLVPAAQGLFARAVADGWDADGAPGFVYTTDWDGSPVVRQRMHWVPAEAVGAAATLHLVTGEADYAARYEQWWDYIERYVADYELGSWHHELDPRNRPAATVWDGKADTYHAYQATLIPRYPVGPCLAVATKA
jgi:mannose/cellobiose epimerase-like protein (N-acyl-D-glucosamine 2-epimerase family)